MKKNRISEFTLAELRAVRDILNSCKNIDEAKTIVDGIISKKEEIDSKNPNVRFDMDDFINFRVFDPEDLRILQLNNINNLQELIDCDLDDLIGMTISSYERLDWARKAYDMSGYVEKTDTSKRK